jgi:hypothetical protein
MSQPHQPPKVTPIFHHQYDNVRVQAEQTTHSLGTISALDGSIETFTAVNIRVVLRYDGRFFTKVQLGVPVYVWKDVKLRWREIGDMIGQVYEEVLREQEE